MKDFKVFNRKSVMTDLKDFCAFGRENDYIEVTEWSNLEGYDVTILSTSGEKSFSLTEGEFDALKSVIKFLRRDS